MFDGRLSSASPVRYKVELESIWLVDLFHGILCIKLFFQMPFSDSVAAAARYLLLLNRTQKTRGPSLGPQKSLLPILSQAAHGSSRQAPSKVLVNLAGGKRREGEGRELDSRDGICKRQA